MTNDVVEELKAIIRKFGGYGGNVENNIIRRAWSEMALKLVDEIAPCPHTQIIIIGTRIECQKCWAVWEYCADGWAHYQRVGD